MKKSTLILAVASVLSLGLVTAGCSSTSEAAPASSGPASETEKPFIIGTSGTYNPITFTDGGTLTGFDIDMGTAIAEKLGRPVKFVEGQLAGLLTGLQGGQYDAVMSSLTITPEREEAIAFSDPYLADGVVAVADTENSKVSDISHLDGLRVGVIGGSGYQKTIEKIGGYADLVEYPDAPSGFQDVKNGRIDIFASGKIPATTFVKADTTGGVPLDIAGEPYALLPAAVGIAKGNTELISQVNEAIAALRADGTAGKLADKWFGFGIPGFTD
ncbi:transporter substrate-binding domain-containing protein [Mycetocola tolaasinivorans]|uniref:transporter substrate-binding domain-containing protein n=1 Tax=Mycetocola tolaasinivorans TaxID=76635 RepID=UPI0016009840|nr:transporter substrate-binding domain-containing protein [Mycetocola tolaasinivorans]